MKILFAAIRCLVMPLVVMAVVCRTNAQNPEATLTAWFNSQSNIQTWSADFVQTRTLKAIDGPLTAKGHVWFAAPNRFHWEVREPATNIAVRQADRLLVITPKLKRVEEYPLGGNEAGQWKDTLALLDAGFPRNREEVTSRFEIAGQTTTNGVHELTLKPKSASARQFMPQIRIAFDVNTFALRSTELWFADGSTMKNDFTNAEMNPKLDESLFDPQIPADYKVTKPLSNGR